MTGYVDGSFRPDQAVTLEEGCAALLKALGYDPTALKGAYPAAQLSRAGALGLLDGGEQHPVPALCPRYGVL